MQASTSLFDGLRTVGERLPASVRTVYGRAERTPPDRTRPASRSRVVAPGRAPQQLLGLLRRRARSRAGRHAYRPSPDAAGVGRRRAVQRATWGALEGPRRAHTRPAELPMCTAETVRVHHLVPIIYHPSGREHTHSPHRTRGRVRRRARARAHMRARTHKHTHTRTHTHTHTHHAVLYCRRRRRRQQRHRR